MGPQGPAGPDPFADYAQAEATAETSTASATYQQKLRLTTANLAAGNYRIGYSAEMTNSNRGGSTEIRIIVDGANVVAEFQNGRLQANNRHIPMAGFAVVALGGVHDIDIEYRALSNTARIRRARLEIYPVP
jgi:hypothetical protein